MRKRKPSGREAAAAETMVEAPAEGRSRPRLSRSDVRLRAVRDGDLDVFFVFRTDPGAMWMVAATHDPPDRASFDSMWERMRTDASVTTRTIECAEEVVGYIKSWEHFSQREVEFWIGREHWGKGIATAALAKFLGLEPERPLYAEAAQDNLGAIRVLERFAFQVVQEGTNLVNARNKPVRIFLLAVDRRD